MCMYERKRESMTLRSVPSSTETALHMKAAGQQYVSTGDFFRLAGAVSADANISIELNRRVSAAWAPLRMYASKPYDRPTPS